MARKNKPKPPKPPEGRYVSGLTEEVLTRRQRMRSLYMLLATLTFAVTIFIPQDALDENHILANLTLTTLYILFIIGSVVVSVIVPYYALRRHKIRREVTQSDAPKSGFEKRTFASFEWFMYLHFAMVAVQLALAIYCPDWGSILCVALMAAGAAFAVIARIVSYRTYATDVEFIPPVRVDLPDELTESDAAEDFYDAPSDLGGEENTNGDARNDSPLSVPASSENGEPNAERPEEDTPAGEI